MVKALTMATFTEDRQLCITALKPTKYGTVEKGIWSIKVRTIYGVIIAHIKQEIGFGKGNGCTVTSNLSLIASLMHIQLTLTLTVHPLQH